jgi:hypothetical protein
VTRWADTNRSLPVFLKCCSQCRSRTLMSTPLATEAFRLWSWIGDEKGDTESERKRCCRWRNGKV